MLFVSKLKKNLFSIGKEADKGFSTIYAKNACSLTSNGSQGKIGMVGRRVNKLYKLSITIISPDVYANIATSSRLKLKV